jgi:hypothetical protein
MKRNLIKLMVIAFIPFLSCRDEVDVDGLLSFPPAIQESYPFDNGKVVIGGFDVRIVFADGANSPLKSASVVIKDAANNELINVAEDLTGTVDSVKIDGSAFDADQLGEGDYTMIVKAEDSKGQSQTYEINFSIITSLYPANNDEMYLAGEFNAWGATPLTLVGEYTWEVKEVSLAGKWKFKNTTDWSDEDWGDGDCDGTMAITSGGGPDTDCGYEGLVNIQFNDQTLKYTITPAVTFATNLSGLYLLGTFNQFEGPPDYKFSLKADHTWELAEIRLKPGDKFKFAETKTFQGKNYGDAEFDGEAEEFGPIAVVPNSKIDGIYKIVFNDETFSYTVAFLRKPFPANLYLVGGSTVAGWDPPSSIQFKKIGEGIFETYARLDPTGGGFKFLEQKDWPGDWGVDPNNAGKIIQEGESNATVSTLGFYQIKVNYNDLSYTAVRTSWGIVGDATPGGWGADTDMTFVAPNKWTIDVTLLGTGEFKFRANDDWPINLGKDTGNTLKYDGGNYATPGAGNYHIELILDSVNGYTYTITPI